MEKNCESCRYTNQARWDTPCRNCVGYIAWKGQELTEYAKDAQSELAELRAFKAACEGQAAAAYVVKDDEGEQLMYPGAIFKYRMASEDDIVADLFTHPDPEAAQLRLRIADLEAKLEMAEACLAADNALIVGLKNDRAERDQQVAEACALLCDKRRKTVSNGHGLSMWSHDPASVEASYCAEHIRSGEWKNHMKGGE